MRRFWLPVAAVVAAAEALTACTETSGGEGAGKSSTTTAEAEEGSASASKDVKILKSRMTDHQVWGPDVYLVHYKIVNHGVSSANYSVQLEFRDADGDILGTTGVIENEIGPGKTRLGETRPVDADIPNERTPDIRSVRISQVNKT
ncbi:hypothetical protein [Streptomyces sp. NPDC014685]|uniref:hypothetical protein n=1 Tax=Streptomyces sp. NPDC014685 TaxID=3364881 RepID=UPI0036FE7511